MKRLVLFSALLAFAAGAFAQTSQSAPTSSGSQLEQGEAVISSNGPVVTDYGEQVITGQPSKAELKIAQQVRHQLLMLPLPYYGKFDDLEYSVQGRTVTLNGWLTAVHSGTKQDAENAVKRIEGVDKVVNNIKILPPLPLDEQAREHVFRALANQGPLAEYFWPLSPDIRIIVDRLNVTLKGYVNSEADKNLATIAAKNVRNVFNVTNDLQVVR